MGCCASTSSVGPRRPNLVYQQRGVTVDEHGVRKLANVDESGLAERIQPRQMLAFARAPVTKEKRATCLEDEMELQHLAQEFGRDTRGRPLPDFYLPQTRDLSKEDGTDASHVRTQMEMMEGDEAMQSDGRLTPEPGVIGRAFADTKHSLTAKYAARSHSIDYDELRWINQPCPMYVMQKVRQWDGVHSLGDELEDPGVLEMESLRRVSSAKFTAQQQPSPAPQTSDEERAVPNGDSTGSAQVAASPQTFVVPTPEQPATLPEPVVAAGEGVLRSSKGSTASAELKGANEVYTPRSGSGGQEDDHPFGIDSAEGIQ